MQNVDIDISSIVEFVGQTYHVSMINISIEKSVYN